MIILWTLIPFLVFMGLVTWFQLRERKRRSVLMQESQTIFRTVSRSVSGMYQRTYGRPSSQLEKVFPEIAANK